MPLTLPFPAIDPVLVEFGPLVIRWYALAYVGGLLIGWRYMLRLADGEPKVMERRDVDDFLLWATLGIILGGRLGYVLFYNAEYFLSRPLEIFAMWRGGMSFHGGLLGVGAAIVLFSRKRGLNLLGVCDLIALVAPIGLFFGRVANFINGELFGRPSELPWAMVFPHGGPQPRHPSQLYEAAIEGLVLLLVLHLMVRARALERRGTLAGAFLIGYAVARMLAELFREPDAYLGFLLGGTTMGQWLSLPLLLAGLVLVVWARRARA